MTNSFSVCMEAILPVFLLMAVGYAAKRLGIIKEETIPAMNTVAFKTFLPVMSFFNIYNSDPSSSLQPRLMVFSAVMIVVVFSLSVLFARFFVRDPRKLGVVIQGLFRSNYLAVGLPVASMLVPDGDAGVISVLTAVTVPIFNILAIIVLDYYSGEKINAGKLLRDCLKNPLIIACGLGILSMLLKFRFPSPIETTLRDMSRVGSPLMLFLLGAFFRFDKIGPNARELTAVLLGRLIVIPAAVLPVAILLGFRGIELATILVLSGAATAVASFTMAQQMGGDASLAGNIVVFTSIGCTFTLFFWSMLLMTYGLL